MLQTIKQGMCMRVQTDDTATSYLQSVVEIDLNLCLLFQICLLVKWDLNVYISGLAKLR